VDRAARRLLRLIWSAGAPLGAYEAATQLAVPGRSAHPASVYRLLQSFQEAGLVLPIVTWNRYLVSPDPAVRLWGLLLCRSCRSCTAVDLASEQEALDRRLEARAFAGRRCCIECEGECRACLGRGPVE
jgi:Fe2+ or Zn2+ uptake regulation protein